MTIYEDEDFSIVTYEKPHHSRDNGGHIVINPKRQFTHLEDMDDASLVAMLKLAKKVAAAMKQVLADSGINIVRINYQVNGNWAYLDPEPRPFVHLHLYGRTAGEKHPDNDPKFQPFPEALCFPNPKTDYYKKFNPLTEEDCKAISKSLGNKSE